MRFKEGILAKVDQLVEAQKKILEEHRGHIQLIEEEKQKHKKEQLLWENEKERI